MAEIWRILVLSLYIINCNCKNIFVINSYTEESQDELVSVVVLYRHGDRSPMTSYPTDPYFNISYWPEGYGELLNKGKERQYNLGQWFRSRYATFLPDEYSPSYFRVMSTNVDRALMSAAANLAGLFPPPTSQIWNEDLPWQPIPIHILSPDNDEILAMNKECPKLNKLYAEVDSSEYFKNVSIENAEMLEYISNHTGRNVTTIGNVANLYSVFYVYRCHNASYIPSWADALDQQKFSYLTGLQLSKYSFTEEMRRLKVGPFFNYLTGYFDNIVQNTTGTPKFLMLSGHDTTITTVLHGMGTYDYWPPEFAATVVWELRKSTNGTHYINLFYKRNSSETLEALVVQDCEIDCVYDDFKRSVSSITINTTAWLDECVLSSAVNFKIYWLLSFLIVVVKFVI